MGNLKRFIMSLMSLIIVLSSEFLGITKIYAREYKINEILPQIESYAKNQLNIDENNGIAFLSVKNVDFETNDQCQELHDILQNKFEPKVIFDVYTRTSGLTIIPKPSVKLRKDNESLYSQADIDFKNKLIALGVENISVIDQENSFKLSDEYHNKIIYSVSKLYNKYFYLTNKYINHVYNKLFSSLEISDVKDKKDAVGEFVVLSDKIVLSPKLFNGSYNKNIKENLEYTIYHEMGHAIEQNLCKKIFKDLNLNNVSKEGCERLAQIYFFGDNSQVAPLIKESVMKKFNLTGNSNLAKQFIRENISEYANTNDNEFFAEVIACELLKNDEKSKQISNFFDEEIKKIVVGEGEIYQKLKEEAKSFLQKNNVI